MKSASPSKLVRSLRIIFIVSAFVTRASVAQASMMCDWIDRFKVFADPSVQEQIHAHVKTLPGLESYQIRQIDRRFFIVSSGEEKCRETSTCLYRLLDVRNGEIKDLFAFQGSGRLWMLISPLSFDYSEFAFETRDDSYLGLRLPLFDNPVLVVPQSSEGIKFYQRLCSNYPK